MPNFNLGFMKISEPKKREKLAFSVKFSQKTEHMG